MRRKIILMINFLIILFLTGILCACKEETSKEADTGFNLYYVDSDLCGLSTVFMEQKLKDGKEQIGELLEDLQQDGVKKGLISAIPDSVKVNGYSITERILTIDFSDEYYQINSQKKEMLCRSAVVLTMEQLDGVDYVAFTINKAPLVIDGVIVEAMNHNNFSSNLGEEKMNFTKTDLTLYFANKNGSALKEYDLKNISVDGMSMEELVLRELINGPDKKGYLATLSENIQVNNVATVDNICYVDFGENFLTEQSLVSNNLVIYSIVNSILELTDINKVQISVNGDSKVFYHGIISLEEPFVRNLDVVK